MTKIFLRSILLVAITAFWATAVNAWDPGIHVDPRCSGVIVTLLPKPLAGNSLGQNQSRWVPDDESGQGFFFWNGKSPMDGVAFVTWKHQVSSDFGMTWSDDPTTLPMKPPLFPWLAYRPANCKPFPQYYPRPKIGDPPNLNKIWPRFTAN